MAKPRKGKTGAKRGTEDVVSGQYEEGQTTSGRPTSTPGAFRDVQVPTGGTLVRSQPGVIIDRWGNSALTRRARPWPDDELQYFERCWRFNIKGYHQFDSADVTAGIPHTTLAEDYMESCYQYAWNICKLARKPRLSQLPAAVDGGVWEDLLNIAHFAIANMVMLNCNFQLIQYSEGFQIQSSYLPDKMVRLYRLWKRISSVIMPHFIKPIAIADGAITVGTREPTPHISRISYIPLDSFGVADYDAPGFSQSSESLYDQLTVSADIDAMLDDIESAVQVLEGYVGGGDTPFSRAEVLAVLEVWMLLSTVESKFCPGGKDIASLYGQGLPDLRTMPGLFLNDRKITDWYCRGFHSYDDDNSTYNFFPVINDADLNLLVPVKGFGQIGDEEHTLVGNTKFFGAINDTDDGTAYTAASGKVIAYGTLCSNSTVANYSLLGPNLDHSYNREDGSIDHSPGENMNDGASIQGWFNVQGGHWLKHIYLPAVFQARLAGNFEHQFVDRSFVDYEFWPDPNKYGETHALWLSDMLGLPLLG
jgi:hypothetical protein